MPRCCSQCGYDVSNVPVRAGGRLCTECGVVGRGLRPGHGWVWAAWRTARPFVISLAAAWVLMVVTVVVERAVGDDFPATLFGWAGVLVTGWAVLTGLVQAATVPVRWADTWPRPGRAGRVAAALVGSLVIDALALMVAMVSLAVSSELLFEPRR